MKRRLMIVIVVSILLFVTTVSVGISSYLKSQEVIKLKQLTKQLKQVQIWQQELKQKDQNFNAQKKQLAEETKLLAQKKQELNKLLSENKQAQKRYQILLNRNAKPFIPNMSGNCQCGPALSGKTVYLTFDDGPGIYTEKILKILEQNQIPATFFVTNQQPSYHYLMKKMVKDGHSIGLHTATHNYRYVYQNETNYFEDLNTMRNRVLQITGITSHLIRFPGGSSNTVSRFNAGIMTRLTQLVTNRGFCYFDWNSDSGDAAYASSEAMLQNVKEQATNLSTIILLLHDTHQTTVEALPMIIQFYRNQGYRFLPLENGSPCMHHRIYN